MDSTAFLVEATGKFVGALTERARIGVKAVTHAKTMIIDVMWSVA